MGALTDTRKRSLLDHHHRFPTPLSDFSSPSKKPKLFPSSPPPPPAAARTSPPSPSPSPPPPPPPLRTMPPALRRFPPPAPLRRPVHGPQRILKVLGLGSGSGSQFTPPGPEQRDPGPSANGTLGLEEYKRMVVDVQEEASQLPTPEPVEMECTPVKELPVVMREPTEVSDLYILDRKVEESGKVVMESVAVREERVARLETPRSRPLYKDLYELSVRKYDSVLRGIAFEVEFFEKKMWSFQSVREALKKPTQDLPGPFTPLTDEEEDTVNHALRGGNRHEVLVVHKASNIEITREVLRCLSYGAWLNDEVINVYLELLKERETREPKRFLKCHFFNSFFYKKLISGKNGYDFKAIRRWTSQKRLGYSLIECDKIFVPIHKEVHWCLAVINVKDKSFQYLDSLGGMDKMALRVLARYLVDEVKDKSDKQIDAISWRQEAVEDLPLQKNGWDCGMFMLKYSDFYSRGLGLSFGQEHMEYFRKRTIQEILRLRAE